MAYLLLEDGTLFEGRPFGAEADSCGETVFFTGMEGYQECLTAPACSGHIVVMTYPCIGNYGINSVDSESDRPYASGVVVHDICGAPGNFLAEEPLGAYLKKHGVPGISGIDTRALTRKIRNAKKPLAGKIVQKKPKAAAFQPTMETAPIQGQKYELPGTGANIAVLDLGARKSELAQLNSRGAAVTVFPIGSTAEEVVSSHPAGVLLSSGPEQFPDALIETVKGLVGKVPVFGIGAGCLALALAKGFRTARLSHGHRGANQPVKNCVNGKMTVTSQYHGLTIDEKSMGEGAVVTYRNWNDKSVEGFMIAAENAGGVLFYPEPAAGPHDTAYLYDAFMGAANGEERN